MNSVDAGLARQGDMPVEKVRKIEVKSLVDTGALTLTINEVIAKQLGLNAMDQANVALADGSITKCDIVGPVDVHFENRIASCPALVLPGADEVLLGSVPLELMDVMIDPRLHRLVVHPSRPHLALMKVK
jgi:clan AA aspartic protease